MFGGVALVTQKDGKKVSILENCHRRRETTGGRVTRHSSSLVKQTIKDMGNNIFVFFRHF